MTGIIPVLYFSESLQRVYAMPRPAIPSAFCWTKMGIEAGEDLDSIVRRKEWERLLGSGIFVWGVGQSLGDNAQTAAEQLGELAVLFSPMLSHAKNIDSAPGEVVVWNCWTDSAGRSYPLPKHVLVTSRATLPSGRQKTNHYALVCRSEKSLLRQQSTSLRYAALRNLISDKPLGDSQVTAVVRVAKKDFDRNVNRVYPVSFSAKLERPYFVRLTQPRVLEKSEIEAINRITSLGTPQSWAALVQEIRGRENLEPDACDLFDAHLWAGALVPG